MEISVLII